MGSLQEVPSRATEVVAQPGDGRDALSQALDLLGRRRPLALPRTRAGPEQLVVGGRGGKSGPLGRTPGGSTTGGFNDQNLAVLRARSGVSF